METLDLRRLPEATRTDEGVMAALSIARVIERVGTVITQTIPDDPNGRNVYVYFTHPQGRIAISPVDEAGHVRWRFTDDTVASARVLYAATSGNPVVPGASLPIPHTAYFSLRAAVAKSAPQLLRPVGDWGMEQWQVLICLVAVLAGGAVAMLVWLALRYGPSRAAGWSPARRASLSGPPVMLITALAWRFVTPALGLPHGVLAAAHGAAALLLAAAVTWGGWVVLGQVGERLSGGEHGERVSDEIVVPLALGCARVVLIGGMLIYVADALSVPYGGLIAGLGISGLALALASKETLSNIFGAAILVVDRPFRRGDTIAAGDTKGVVEHVGIRSTRIRTAEDSVIVLPNGKLADATINNLGTRRFRLSSASLVLPFATTPETIIAFVDSVRSLANTMPGVVADRTEVSVSALTSAGVQVDMTFYLAVQSGIEERAVRQRLMLAIIGLGDCMGVPVGPSHIPRTPLVTVPLVAAQDNKLAIA